MEKDAPKVLCREFYLTGGTCKYKNKCTKAHTRTYKDDHRFVQICGHTCTCVDKSHLERSSQICRFCFYQQVQVFPDAEEIMKDKDFCVSCKDKMLNDQENL
jgi:hypothetical protein